MIRDIMVLTASLTAALGLLAGRYINLLGLILTSLAVLAASAAVLFNAYTGVWLWVLVGLNVAVFEVTAICSMVYTAPPRGKPALPSHALTPTKKVS